MKRTALLTLLSISTFTTAVFAQQDSMMLDKIYHESFYQGQAYDNLHYLTKQIGHRIAGSPAADKAVVWSKSLMEKLDFDKVYQHLCVWIGFSN